MSTTIPQRDLRNHNAQIIERVAAGESFVVTRNGVPVADVTPHNRESRPPRFRKATDVARGVRLSREAIDTWNEDLRRLREAIDDEPSDPWERSGAHDR